MKEEKKVQEITFEQKLDYDVRRQILTSTITKFEKGMVEGTYTDKLTRNGIKRLHQRLKGDKKKVEIQIESSEKMVSMLSDKRDDLKKVLPDLTVEQKKLAEDLKILIQVEPLKETKDRLKKEEDLVENLKKDLKDKNKLMNDLRTKVKFKLE